MSNFQIQQNSHEVGSFSDGPWAAQVANLVENSPFLDKPQQMESIILLEGIGVARTNFKRSIFRTARSF